MQQISPNNQQVILEEMRSWIRLKPINSLLPEA